MYELRRGDTFVATGWLSREEPFQVGEHVVIGGQIVSSVRPQLVRGQLRLGRATDTPKHQIARP